MPLDAEQIVPDRTEGSPATDDGQLRLDLHQRTSKRMPIGNRPVLMIFKFFPLSAEEGSYHVSTPYGDGVVSFRCEGSEKYGIATQSDKQFLIFVISKLHDLRKQGERTNIVTLTLNEYLKGTGQASSGYTSKSVRSTIQRLSGTKVYTNIDLSTESAEEHFSWIQYARISTKPRRDGMSQSVTFTIQLCDWLLDLVDDPRNELIGYPPEFFNLRSSFLQRMCEAIMAETQLDRFKIDMKTLMERTSATDEDPKLFKRHLKRLFTEHHDVVGFGGKGQTLLPGYAVYPYSAAMPSKSTKWSQRTLKEKQYFVFERNDVQKEALNVPLSEIPDWQPNLSQREQLILTSQFVGRDRIMTS